MDMKFPDRQLTGKLRTFIVALAGFPFLAPGFSMATDSALQVIPIEMGDYSFLPKLIEVRAGSTVQIQLTNKDAVVPHNFSLRDDTTELDIDVSVAAGETRLVEITPLVPGSYKYYCNKKLPFMKSHRKRGMEGTLNVVPAKP
jgi:plastocyanin